MGGAPPGLFFCPPGPGRRLPDVGATVRVRPFAFQPPPFARWVVGHFGTKGASMPAERRQVFARDRQTVQTSLSPAFEGFSLDQSLVRTVGGKLGGSDARLGPQSRHTSV